jgi:hypothetical protein
VSGRSPKQIAKTLNQQGVAGPFGGKWSPSTLYGQDLFEEFCDEFTREMNRLRMEHRASVSSAEHELERVQGDIRRVIEAIKNGFAGPDLKAEWNALQERKAALQARLDSADERPPLLRLGMAELYRQKVTDLAQALEHPDTRTEAAEAIRGLIDAIALRPAPGRPRSARRSAGSSNPERCGRPGERPPDRIAGESGRDAECGSKRNEVAAKRRPRIADSDGCGARNPLNLEFSWTAAQPEREIVQDGWSVSVSNSAPAGTRETVPELDARRLPA